MPEERYDLLTNTIVPIADTPHRGQARLDHHEITVEPPAPADSLAVGEPPTLAESFRHSGWHRHRKLVYDALRRQRTSVTRIARFCTCGTDGWFLRSVEDPTRFRFATNACRDRLCLPCSQDRGYVIRHNVLAQLRGQPARFVTLTLRQSPDSLDTALTRILACFRRLRQRMFWQRRVTGGVAFIEFKWGSRNQQWNVHLHVITHGRYIPKADLQAEWYAITGDSYIVDVSFVRDEARVAGYVTTYCTKPYDRDTLTAPALIDEIVHAVHRKHMVVAFGDWVNVATTKSPTDGEWTTFGDMETVLSWANNDDPDALEALAQTIGNRSWEAIRLWWQPHTPQPPPDVPTMKQLHFSWPSIDNRF